MKNIGKIKKKKKTGEVRTDPCKFVARLQTLVVRRLDKTIHWMVATRWILQ